nr:trihelix transcription factor ASIL1-like [Setaria viridis]
MTMMDATRRRPLPPPPAWTPEPWSDGETSALLDAWGPRHLRARGGALRPADWRACAAAVTSRRAADGRAPRTVDQCKNRVDYLKKRLRAERARPKGGPPPPPPVSGWLDRLRALLHLAPSAPPGFAHRPAGATTTAKVKEEDENDDDHHHHKASGGAPLPRDWPPVPKRPRTAVSLSPLSAASGEHPEGGGRSCVGPEVAAALDRLAGTYERVEAAKQREATRLEERRLEAMRDLEIERMRLLVDVAVTSSVGVDGAAAAATAGGDF